MDGLLRGRSVRSPSQEDEESLSDLESPREKPFAFYTRHVRSLLAFSKRHQAAATGGLAGLLLVLLLLRLALGGGSDPGGKGELFTCPSSLNGKPEAVKPFIYIYDFGNDYTADIRKVTPSWYSEVYDAEKLYFEYVFERSAIRTWTPESATLFYVPFFSAYFTSCKYRDWELNMKGAVRETSQMWATLLSRVRSEFPFFNRTNGADHFSVLSLDFGRCQALTFVDPSVNGDMFFIQMNGEKILRSTHAHEDRGMQALAYNYGKPVASNIPDIPCYRPEMDIIVPPPLELQSKGAMPIVSPLSTDRSITALLRFSPEHHHGKSIIHSNHDIRKELYQLYERKGLEGWDFGVKDPEKVFREDMAHSVFCICPPGHSQWTSRLTKAILSGCIPVTFFRDSDSPWQEELDYTLFSVNVDPDKVGTLVERLDDILRNPRKLIRMQKNVQTVQAYFEWAADSPVGVQAFLTRKLWCRAQQLERSVVGRIRREAKGKRRRVLRLLL